VPTKDLYDLNWLAAPRIFRALMDDDGD
jgi:hypothetical protein